MQWQLDPRKDSQIPLQFSRQIYYLYVSNMINSMKNVRITKWLTPFQISIEIYLNNFGIEMLKQQEYLEYWRINMWQVVRRRTSKIISLTERNSWRIFFKESSGLSLTEQISSSVSKKLSRISILKRESVLWNAWKFFVQFRWEFRFFFRRKTLREGSMECTTLLNRSSEFLIFFVPGWWIVQFLKKYS